MKNILILLFCLMCLAGNVNAQKYFTKTGKISFYSKTPIEEIEAESNSASTVFDMESGKIQWAVLIKSFEFEKALMQEHFNENYMESSKFPKASFKGNIIGFEKLDLGTDGTHELDIVGVLTIHGVTNDVETTASFKIENGEILASSKLNILIADYQIEVPSVVSKNIAEKIDINIEASYAKLEQ